MFQLFHGKALLCEVCGRFCTSEGGLKRHQVVHFKSRLCTKCDQPFMTVRSPKQHSQQHHSNTKSLSNTNGLTNDKTLVQQTKMQQGDINHSSKMVKKEPTEKQVEPVTFSASHDKSNECPQHILNQQNCNPQHVFHQQNEHQPSIIHQQNEHQSSILHQQNEHQLSIIHQQNEHQSSIIHQQNEHQSSIIHQHNEHQSSLLHQQNEQQSSILHRQNKDLQHTLHHQVPCNYQPSQVLQPQQQQQGFYDQSQLAKPEPHPVLKQLLATEPKNKMVVESNPWILQLLTSSIEDPREQYRLGESSLQRSVSLQASGSATMPSVAHSGSGWSPPAASRQCEEYCSTLRQHPRSEFPLGSHMGPTGPSFEQSAAFSESAGNSDLHPQLQLQYEETAYQNVPNNGEAFLIEPEKQQQDAILPLSHQHNQSPLLQGSTPKSTVPCGPHTGLTGPAPGSHDPHKAPPGNAVWVSSMAGLNAKNRPKSRVNNGHFCIFCGKYYKHRASLKTHSRTHLDCQVCICQICNQNYKNIPTLMKHLLTHSEMVQKEYSISWNEYKWNPTHQQVMAVRRCLQSPAKRALQSSAGTPLGSTGSQLGPIPGPRGMLDVMPKSPVLGQSLNGNGIPTASNITSPPKMLPYDKKDVLKSRSMPPLIDVTKLTPEALQNLIGSGNVTHKHEAN